MSRPKSRSPAPWVALACLGLMAATADARSLFTFGYTDTMGSFDGGSSYTLSSNNVTAGDVTRLVPTPISAIFRPSFAATAADFSLTMNVGEIDNNTWSGSGSFTITDADGDTIVGDISGRWHRLTGNESAFTGTIRQTTLNGETFDGTHGGSFSMDTSDIGNEPFNGAITILKAGGWFSNGAFSEAVALAQGTIIPAPGAAVLGLLGITLMQAVRRRKAAA
jgi:hypothetical protein